MRQLDLVVVVVYLVAIAVIGLRLAGRQKTAKDYFVGEGSMPWWTVSFSVVATETSVLTVISLPGGAYSGQRFGNVELALGYVIGRVVVATVLIPLYKRGGFGDHRRLHLPRRHQGGHPAPTTSTPTSSCTDCPW